MKTCFICLKALWPVLCLAAGIGLSGCAMFTEVDSGTPVSGAARRSLVHGMPYREVVAELGPPLLELDGTSAIAYFWSTRCGYYQILWSEPKPMNLRHRALFLKFDGDQTLEDWTIVTERDAPDLRLRMVQWVKGNQPPP